MLSLDEAVAFVARAGIALIFPRTGSPLPSLWEEVGGPGPIQWAVRDEGGKFEAFTAEFEAVWRWKDELPERRLACVGKHLGKAVVAISPELIGAVYALCGRRGRPDDFEEAELSPLQMDIAEAILDAGPCAVPDLRALLGHGDSRRLQTAADVLQQQLVLTSCGRVERPQGWPAVRLELFARHWAPHLSRLPDPEEARLELARRVVQACGEVTPQELARALGWPRKQAQEVLHRLAEPGLQAG